MKVLEYICLECYRVLLNAKVILSVMKKRFRKEGREDVRHYYALPLEINVHVTIRKSLEK